MSRRKVTRQRAPNRPENGKIGTTEILKISVSVLFRRFGPRKVSILHLKTNRTYELTDLAAYIWVLLDGSRTVENVLVKVKKDLQIDAPKFEHSALQLLRSLFDAHLVVPCESVAKSETPGFNFEKSSIRPALSSLELLQKPAIAAAGDTSSGFSGASGSCGASATGGGGTGSGSS